MIIGSAATVSERSPPASCIRMIAPGPRAADRRVDDRLHPGHAVVIRVDRPQDHQHPVAPEQRQRRVVPQPVGRAEQPRERRAVLRRSRTSPRAAAAAGRAGESSDIGACSCGVIADRVAVGDDLGGRGVEVLLEHADLEERRRHVHPLEHRAAPAGVYGPGPSSNVSASSRCWVPAIRTYGV